MQAPGPPLQAQPRARRQETDRASAHIRASGFPHGPQKVHKRGGPGKGSRGRASHALPAVESASSTLLEHPVASLHRLP